MKYAAEYSPKNGSNVFCNTEKRQDLGLNNYPDSAFADSSTAWAYVAKPSYTA